MYMYTYVYIHIYMHKDTPTAYTEKIPMSLETSSTFEQV